MHPIDDTPWNQGPKIIVAFDIGNTQATVSFAHLRPGSPPCIHTVCQWPGQQNQGGEAKVPTLTWYDSAGQARAFGAEARTFSVLDQAEDCGWCLAKNFKQHLYPRAMRGQHIVELDPLPTQVSMEQIYADFMSYLFRHTRAFFCERIIDGERSWQSLQDTIDFAITYPSQWGIVEQGLLRYAMVKAGIVPSLRASQERVHFVSEALAAAHLCLVHANPVKDLKVSDKIIICDAGESSANTTLYSVDETEPLICLREACTPSRKVTGELFVKRNAQVFFTKLFTDAGLDEESIAGYVDDALESFACEAMRSFEHDSEDKRISVGGRRFTNAQLNVRRGSLILKGTQIQKFFEPCVTEVVESVVSQLEGHMVQHVFLIGKFGESSYLRQRLNEEINRKGLKVTTISDSPSKRIVDGAVIWLVRHVAATRTTRFAFGVETRIDVEPIEIPKIGRKVVPSPSGPKYEGGWAEIISKVSTFFKPMTRPLETVVIGQDVGEFGGNYSDLLPSLYDKHTSLDGLLAIDLCLRWTGIPTDVYRG
ncbi:hypothetical protein BOTBODRAFT_53653 [Botryobasidium botryosum FD-172 SS1]|uniref:Actin-like ATPase domain-containing protein n=1 Tax=Botryobasidium botryosum (strain FD-172 SS1) TaxID=930990 RepID=A0A067MZS4_BOTB1|nr:hypothetical protein BOTBODRAFT_53653 [Botryobasidium botryosum FD-172 SS1]